MIATLNYGCLTSSRDQSALIHIAPEKKTVAGKAEASTDGSVNVRMIHTGEIRPPTEQLRELYSRLVSFQSIEDDWDGYGAPKPARDAISQAITLVSLLVIFNLTPSAAHPSPEGGIVLSFLRNGRHAALEAYNDSQIYAIFMHANKTPEVWEWTTSSDDYLSSVRRLQGYLE